MGSKSGIEVTGSQSYTEVTGSNSDTEVIGSKSDTEVIGSQSYTEVTGSKSDTEVIGSKSDTEVTGFKQSMDQEANRRDLRKMQIFIPCWVKPFLYTKHTVGVKIHPKKAKPTQCTSRYPSVNSCQ
jgi:hypothetical protein